MSAESSAESDALLEATRRFLAREVDAAAIEAAGRIPERVITAAAEQGLFGLTIPAEYGGLGLSLSTAASVVAEIARVDRSTAIMVGLHAGLGTYALVHHGSEEQRARWLPALASGERIASFAATEPNAGSDLHAIRTIAREDGDALVLEGEKAYVTNGGFAGLYTLLVRTPTLGGERSFSLVCVPREADGVEIGPEEDKLGVKASSTITLHLDDARVPRDHLLGTPGAGMELAHETLARGRLLMAAGCVGTARYALDASLAHVTTRKQFRRPIGDFDATRSTVATMAATHFAMESLVEAAAVALDDNTPEAQALSSAAKVYCSEGAFTVCDAAVQLHGAMGFLEPTGVARALRDCRITRIFEGANDVLLVLLGAAALARRSSPVRDGSPHAALADLDRRRVEAIGVYRAEMGVRATQRQLLAQRIARAEVCSLAAWSCLDRIARDERYGDEAAYAVELLTRDGHRQLDQLRTLEVDERAAARISARAYAPFIEARTP